MLSSSQVPSRRFETKLILGTTSFLRLIVVIWSSVLGFSIPAFSQTSEVIVATINGEPITQREVDESVSSRITPLKRQLYSLRKVALENLITRRLLEIEARNKNSSVEAVRKRMMDGPVNVTTQEVESEYIKNSAFFATMSPDEAKERLRLDLESRARMKRFREAIATLRSTSALVLNLPPPISEINSGGPASPTRGAKDAPVTIVEFSDFECRFCSLVQPTLKQVLQEYGEDVRLVFKYLPSETRLNSIAAARAAYCAGKQDRFWEFHDALFAAPSRAADVIAKLVTQLGLQTKQFEKCQQSDESLLAVMKDVEAARAQQINGTPSFIINDNHVSGAISFADFQRLIDRELHRSSPKASSSN